MKWIDVKDQEPPKDRDFLGYCLIGYPFSMISVKRDKEIRLCKWDDKKYIESCDCSGYEHDREYIEVLCWMELPIAPM